MRVRNLPVWALLFCIPVALLALNCGPANLDSDQVAFNDDLTTAVGTDANEMNVDANADLNLEDGATDEWWGRWGGWGRWGRWGGWGGWGRWGGWGGWGGFGGGWWPYYSWSYWPFYSGLYW